MPISAEIFNGIIQSLPGNPSSDKRKSPRMGLAERMIVVAHPPAKDQRPVEVIVRNLSAGGVGILHIEDLQRGHEFDLRIKSAVGNDLRRIICTVRWSQPVNQGYFAIGEVFKSGDSGAE